jgi:exopolysaccharide biosynthesis polyprenyl glycosylphosphotransferase
MSQAALQRHGADLDQNAGTDASLVRREAGRLADLAAEFALFGLRLDQLDVDGMSDAAYRVAAEITETPANDVNVPRAFPVLRKRGLHIDPRLPTQFVQVFDWIAVIIAAEATARWGAGVGLTGLSIGAAVAYLASAGCLKIGMWLTESYRGAPANARAERGLGGLTLGAILGLIAANALAPDARAAGALSATLPFAAMLMAGVHAALAIWTRAAHRKGVFAETVLLIGATDAAARLAERAAKTGDARIVAVVDDRLARAPRVIGGVVVGGDIESALAWEGLPHVDRVVITVTQKAETRVRAMIERLRIIPNRVDLLLDFEAHTVRGRGFERLSGAAVACVSGRARNGRRALIKRIEDIVLGGALAVILAAPALIIAAAIKLESPGPALYRQRRHGFNNRTFTVLKFRSMQAGSTNITRVGKLLRQTGFDNLPQLLNVVQGDMSLVGPRPHAIGMRTANRNLDEIIAEYAHRHRVKPGITGWAQIHGVRGAIETPMGLRKRVRLDLEYVARASLWFDLQILLRTVLIPFGLGKADTQAQSVAL